MALERATVYKYILQDHHLVTPTTGTRLPSPQPSSLDIPAYTGTHMSPIGPQRKRSFYDMATRYGDGDGYVNEEAGWYC